MSANLDPVVLSVIDAEHPWPGLMPFTEEASAFFHGRDQEAAELLRLIRRETLTVLFGQSGLGKSSLLNAGLFPKLRGEDFLPIYIRLDVAEEASPFVQQVQDAILAACRAHAVDVPEAQQDATLWGWFHHRDTDFWSARNRLLTPVLVFDQFEEIFTLGRHGEALEARCREFVDELADLIEDRMPARLAARIEHDPDAAEGLDYGKHVWKVVFSFREDYLPEFEGLSALIRPIMRNRMRLTRMSGEQAWQSVCKSGRRLVRPEVAEQIVRFVAAPRQGRETAGLVRLEIEPALMSVVCRELNNRRIAADADEISADLLKTGAQHEIISDYYEGCLADVDARVRVFVEDCLLTDAGYRDSYALDDALRLPGVMREAVDLLIGRRLLRLEERSGVLRVELTHDVLTRVARESRDNRKAAEAQRLALEADTIRRRRARRMALLVGSSLALAIGVAVVFAFLLSQSNEKQQQLLKTQSGVMFSRALTALEQGVPGEPYAMLAEAIRLNGENRPAVARAVALFEQRRHALHLDSARLDAAPALGWLAGGGYLLAAGELVRVSDGKLESVRVLGSGNEHEDAGLLAFRTEPRASLQGLASVAGGMTRLPVPVDAGLLPYVSRNFVLHLFDAASGQSFGRPLPLAGRPVGLGLSPDRRWLAVVTADGRFTLARLDGNSSPRHGVLKEFVAEGENVVTSVSPRGEAFVQGRTFGFMLRPDADPVRIDDVQGRVRISAAAAVMAVPRGRDVQLFDTVRGETLGLPIRHPATVRDIDFSPNGRFLATASLDRLARVWSIESRTLAAPPMRHDGPVLAVRYGGGGKLFTASADGAARVWQPLRGELLVEPMLHGEAVVELAPEPDGDQLLTLTAGNELHRWRWQHPAQPQPLLAPLERITSLAADSRGTSLAWGDSSGRVVAMRSGEQPAILWQQGEGSLTPVSALAFSPDGRRLVVARGTRLEVLDASNGTAEPLAMPEEQSVRSLRFSADGRFLAVLTDRVVRLWDFGSNRPIGWRSSHRQVLLGVSFSPDGRHLLVAERSRLALWEITSGLPRGELELAGSDVSRIVLADFLATGSVLVIGENQAFRLELEKGRDGDLRLPAKLPAGAKSFGDLRVWSAAMSPDARLAALGALDGRVRLLDVASLNFVGEAMRHDDAVLGLNWSGDSREIASWSRDRSVRLWSGETGDALADPILLEREPRLAQPLRAAVAIADELGSVRPIGRAPAGKVPDWLPGLLEATGRVKLKEGGVVRLEAQASPFEVLGRAGAEGNEWSDWAGRVRERLRAPVMPRGNEK